MAAAPDVLPELPPPTPAPPELIERATALVRAHPECFWLRHPEARIRHLDDVQVGRGTPARIRRPPRQVGGPRSTSMPLTARWKLAGPPIRSFASSPSNAIRCWAGGSIGLTWQPTRPSRCPPARRRVTTLNARALVPSTAVIISDRSPAVRPLLQVATEPLMPRLRPLSRGATLRGVERRIHRRSSADRRDTPG